MAKEPHITISSDDRLKALALVTIGNEKYREALAFERALQTMLGLEHSCGGDKISELIYSDDRFTVTRFDEFLGYDGVIVAELEAA